MKRFLAFALASAFFSPLVHAEESVPHPADDRLNAIVWTMTSAEYEASVRMAYAMARTALDAALKNKKHSAALEQTGNFSKLPPAIILDVDETVLSNGPFQVMLMTDTQTRPAEIMSRWVEQADAKPLPGAVEFIQYAQSKGVTAFFITNRNAEKEAATRKNLAGVGIHLPTEVDTVLLEREKPEWTGDKSTRRAEVAAKYRVLLVIGDDFNDFVPAFRVPMAERKALAEKEAARWGRDWIILPNPMYGSWEGASFGFDFRSTPDDRRRHKFEAIAPPK